jgi:hypothetical protein
MTPSPKSIFLAAVLLALAAPAQGQTPPKASPPPPMAMVSIYHVAPGKHVEFLKWLAQRDALDKEVGAPAAQLYVHVDGDSWDYIQIQPQVEPAAQAELQKKMDAAAKKKGLPTGAKLGIEFRSLVSSHTDTLTAGPVTAAAVLEEINK